MTTLDTPSATAADRSLPAALRPVGLGFIAAAILWAVGDAIEIPFSRTDTIADGASFIVSEIFFYAAMLTFALSALFAARRGLASRSITGKVGLVAITVSYLLVMLAGILVNFLGIEAATIGLAIGGLAELLGAIAAGIGILLRGPVPRPARSTFLVYGIAYTIAFFLISGVDGPGYIVEFAQAAYWALIGLSILKPGPRGWNIGVFVAALVIGIVAVAAVILA